MSEPDLSIITGALLALFGALVTVLTTVRAQRETRQLIAEAGREIRGQAEATQASLLQLKAELEADAAMAQDQLRQRLLHMEANIARSRG